MSALGGVLLAAGVILAGGVLAAGASARPREESKKVHGSDKDGLETDPAINTDNLRAITGLAAVVTGIVAVAILTVVAVSLLGVDPENKDATVAIVTAAFGIVSTVVTAFLGIKATANSSEKATAILAEGIQKLDPETQTGARKPCPPGGGVSA